MVSITRKTVAQALFASLLAVMSAYFRPSVEKADVSETSPIDPETFPVFTAPDRDGHVRIDINWIRAHAARMTSSGDYNGALKYLRRTMDEIGPPCVKLFIV